MGALEARGIGIGIEIGIDTTLIGIRVYAEGRRGTSWMFDRNWEIS